jgi:hypothetical protein
MKGKCTSPTDFISVVGPWKTQVLGAILAPAVDLGDSGTRVPSCGYVLATPHCSRCTFADSPRFSTIQIPRCANHTSPATLGRTLVPQHALPGQPLESSTIQPGDSCCTSSYEESRPTGSPAVVVSTTPGQG